MRPGPGNLLWFFWLWKMCLRLCPAVIVFRNVRPALGAILIAKMLKIRIVGDLSENYSAMYSPDVPSRNRFRSKILSYVISYSERLSARNADYVIAVCEENASRLNVLQQNAGRVGVVENFPELSELIVERTPKEPDQALKLVYLGLLDQFRSLDIVLLAMNKLRGKLVTLDVVGHGPMYHALVKLAKELNISNQVRFLGSMRHEAAIQILRTSDVGLVPHLKCETTEATVPNKVYDYFAAGLAVISTDTAPLRRIVTSADAGYLADNEVMEWANAISTFLVRPQHARELGARGLSYLRADRFWESKKSVILEAMGSPSRS